MNEPQNNQHKPPTLDYADEPSPARDRRLLRWIAVVVAAKLVLVALNVTMAFAAGTPGLLRLLGAGAQIALTIVFLTLILRLSARR